MTNRPSHRRRGFLAAGVLLLTATIGMACSSRDLLEVTDPDIVKPGDLQNAAGADAVRLGAIQRWRLTTGADNTNGQESTWLAGGMLSDEWGTASTFVQLDEVDKRQTGSENSWTTFIFRKLNRVRTAVNQAIPLMRTFKPTEATNIAELYFARAFAEFQLASDYCNGIPLSNAATADGIIEYGDPLTVDSIFKIAISSADP